MRIDPVNVEEHVFNDPLIDTDGFVCVLEDIDIGQFGGQLDFGFSGSISAMSRYSPPGAEYEFEEGLIPLSGHVVEDPVIDANGFVCVLEDIDIGQFGGQLDFGFSGSISGMFETADYPARDWRYPAQMHHSIVAAMLK